MSGYRHTVAILLMVWTGLSGCISTSREISPIHQALATGNLEEAKRLADDSRQLETLNRYEETPLLYTIRTGNQDLARYLINKGANVNYKNFRTGMTPLITAIKKGDRELVALLIERGARTDLADNIDQSPLVWASKDNALDITGIILENSSALTAADLNNALLSASSHGRTNTIALLARHGASLSARTADGETPLMLAARFGHPATVEWLMEKAPSQIDQEDAGGNTALIWAARMGRREIVDTLLAAGVRIDHVNDQDHSAITYAVKLGHAGVVNDLAAKGASLNAEREPALNPMYLSAFQEAIAESLFQHGARLIEMPADTAEPLAVALKYLWFGRFYEDRQDNATARKELINSYRWAAGFFDLASSAYQKAAQDLEHEQTVTTWMNIGLIALGATAAQMQAHLQAKQMAELSALNSPTGTGVGYGWASYPVPEDIAATSFDEKIALMRIEAKRSQESASACREVVECYQRGSHMTSPQARACLAAAKAKIAHLK